MRAAILLQYILPHRFLSRLVLWATRWTFAPWKNFLIRRIVRSYDVDLGEAQTADFRAYRHFNAFFTRALKPGARPQPVDPAAIACPADGRISQAGAIGAGRILQAKGQDFSVAELLADAAAAAPYANGSFLTVYLSPRDYHRVHMPLAGTLLETVHVPGRLFSVAPFAVAAIPRLFARNERLVCHFEGEHGPFAVVLAGRCWCPASRRCGGASRCRRMPRALPDATGAGAASCSRAAPNWGASTWARPPSCCCPLPAAALPRPWSPNNRCGSAKRWAP